jgi:cytochrome c oxidase subunit 5b
MSRLVKSAIKLYPRRIPNIIQSIRYSSSNEPGITAADLIPQGAKSGTVPTDIEQATGLERLELLGKLIGKEVFDLKPLSVDRIGTMDNPIVVDSMDDHRYVGCTGLHDSHDVLWYTVKKETPSRCVECGQVFKLNFTGREGGTGHH